MYIALGPSSIKNFLYKRKFRIFNTLFAGVPSVALILKTVRRGSKYDKNEKKNLIPKQKILKDINSLLVTFQKFHSLVFESFWVKIGSRENFSHI